MFTFRLSVVRAPFSAIGECRLRDRNSKKRLRKKLTVFARIILLHLYLRTFAELSQAFLLVFARISLYIFLFIIFRSLGSSTESHFLLLLLSLVLHLCFQRPTTDKSVWGLLTVLKTQGCASSSERLVPSRDQPTSSSSIIISITAEPSHHLLSAHSVSIRSKTIWNIIIYIIMHYI